MTTPSFKKIKQSLLKSSFLVYGAAAGSVILALIAGLLLFNPSEKSEHTDKNQRWGRNREDAPVAVALQQIISKDFHVFLNALGTVTALKNVTARSRVDGEIIKIYFSEGQWVKEGDLLAEVDPRPFQIQLQQAQGQLLKDQALLANAKIDHQRYETLLKQDSIAPQQTAMQESLVKQYQGAVEIDQAQVNNAKLQLLYSKITAPISGQTGLRQIDQGNIIHANDANGLVVITQFQPINVVFTLPEDKLQAVLSQWHSNPSLKVDAYDKSGKVLLATGHLKAIDNLIDSSTGTIKLKAEFDNHAQKLFTNQFVNIRLELETLKSVTQVPNTAIQHENNSSFLYFAKQDNTVEKLQISIGPSDNTHSVILSQLPVDGWVVTEGLDRLKEGSHIDIASRNGESVLATPEKPASENSHSNRRDKHKGS